MRETEVSRVCTRCLVDQPILEFSLNKTSRGGRRPHCKSCIRQYRFNNIEQFKNRDKLYASNNKEKIQKRRRIRHLKNKERMNLISRNYYSNNREAELEKRKVYFNKHRQERYAYTNNKRKTNINYRLSCQLRIRLNIALRNKQKRGSAVDDLGCSIEFLKQYLEAQFQPGMTWENWSMTGWHIDHIRPLCTFDLTVKEQLLEAVNFKNLRPLWAKENLSKNNIRKYKK